MKTKKYKKFWNFLKGFIYINGILGGFIFWLLFGSYLAITLLSDFDFDFSEIVFILKMVAGFLIVIGLPVGINVGVYCAKNNSKYNS